jgi:TolC family type I secretion outer membrane protein
MARLNQNPNGPILTIRRLTLLMFQFVAAFASATALAQTPSATARIMKSPLFDEAMFKEATLADINVIEGATTPRTPLPVPPNVVLTKPDLIETAIATVEPTLDMPPAPITTAVVIAAQKPALQKISTVIRGSGTAALPVREALAESVQAALTTNPEVQIAKAREDDAHYGVSEARAAYLPRVDIAASTGSEYVLPDGQSGTYKRRGDASITSRQLIWDFGLTINDIRRARKLFEAASENTRERVEDISFQIATAYVGVIQRQRLVELTSDNVGAHQKILRIVTTQKDLGLSTGADVSRVDAQLSRVQSTLLDRQSELEQAKETFRRLAGRLPGDLMEPPLPDAALPMDADAAAALINERNPRLKQVLASRASIERQLASNNANFLPRIEAEVQGNYKNDVQGDTNRNLDARALVQLRYNLFNGGADHAVSNRLKARIREQNFEVERVKREVEQDIRSDFSALRASREKVSRINAEVGSAAKVVDLYFEQFKTSRRSAFDLLESQQALFSARTTLVGNQYQSLLSGYRVLQKLGLLFTTIVEAPPSPDRKL